MKKAAARAQRIQPKAAGKKSEAGQQGKIHPVVIYPFRQPSDFSDLEPLYELIARLDADKDTYARPITVMDRKTFHAMEGNKPFLDFRKNAVAHHSDIVDAWCVDTCQMWYSGLGLAFEKGGAEDVYWLIPGDFNYGTAVGREVLGRLHAQSLARLQSAANRGDGAVFWGDFSRLVFPVAGLGSEWPCAALADPRRRHADGFFSQREHAAPAPEVLRRMLAWSWDGSGPRLNPRPPPDPAWPTSALPKSATS